MWTWSLWPSQGRLHNQGREIERWQSHPNPPEHQKSCNRYCSANSLSLTGSHASCEVQSPEAHWPVSFSHLTIPRPVRDIASTEQRAGSWGTAAKAVLWPSYINKYTHTHTRAHTHTDTHIYIHSHTYSLIYTLTQTHIQTQTLTHTQTHTYTHTLTDAEHTYTLTHSCERAHTHTHIHSHTQIHTLMQGDTGEQAQLFQIPLVGLSSNAVKTNIPRALRPVWAGLWHLYLTYYSLD